MDKFRAAALVILRNELPHIDGLIRHLVLEGLDVVVIDHQSDDGSGEAVRRWLGRGVLEVHERPFTGVWRLEDASRWLQEIAQRLDQDWIVHVAADEWPHPAAPGDRLIDLFRRADTAGATAVNFEEFAFLPDSPLAPGADPRERFSSYYFFAPSPYRLMRARRRDAGLSGRESAGHVLRGANLRLHEEQGVLRHYPLLSPEHLKTKYLARRYAPEAVARGWHHNRLNLNAEDLTLDGPAVRRLRRWDSRDFDRTAPVSRHCWEPGELTASRTCA